MTLLDCGPCRPNTVYTHSRLGTIIAFDAGTGDHHRPPRRQSIPREFFEDSVSRDPGRVRREHLAQAQRKSENTAMTQQLIVLENRNDLDFMEVGCPVVHVP